MRTIKINISDRSIIIILTEFFFDHFLDFDTLITIFF